MKGLLKLKYSEKVGLGKGEICAVMFRFEAVNIIKKRNMSSNCIGQKKNI